MKSYYNFRYLFFSVFTSLCISINAQTGGRITAEPKLNKGTSVYDVVNERYGISGSQISTTISIVEKPNLSKDQSISETKYYRVYNNNKQPLQTNSDNGFEPQVGEDQTLRYIVEFTISETGKDDIQFPLESVEFKFSIYDWNGYSLSFSKQPEGAARNTYAGRAQNVEYSVYVDVDNKDKTLPPYRIDWTNNKDNIVVQGNSYSFNPSQLDNQDKVEYTFKSTVKFLKPGTSEVWFEGSYATSETLSVYPKQLEVDNITNLLQYPENISNNTTHNGDTCEYAVNFTKKNYEKYGGIKYVWSNNNQPQANFTSNSYQYVPSVSKKENHTIHVKVTCVNPDNQDEEWYDFINVDFETLTVCLNPVNIKDNIIKNYLSFPKDNGKGHVNTYVGKEKLEYKVNIPSSENYGRWIYSWNRTWVDTWQNNTTGNNTLSNQNSSDVSFTPSTAGTYKTTLSIKCVNPNDNSDNPETWLEIPAQIFSIPDLIVYKDPKDINFTESFIYPTDDDLAEHMGTEDRSRNYRVVLPNDAEKYGKWDFTWTRTKDNSSVNILGNNNKSEEANIPSNVGEGTYKTSLVLKCLDPDTGDEWKNVQVPTFYPYVVYPKPSCTIQNLHQDQDDKETEYAMYVGQTLDVSKLINCDGGYNNGWSKSLEVDGYPSGLSFTPTKKGTYILGMAVKNEAPLSDNSGNKKTLFYDDNKVFIFNVFENPYQNIGYYVNEALVNSNVNEELNEESKEIEINVVDGQKLKLSGSDGDSFSWELKNSNNTINQNSGNSFEWICVNEASSEDDASEYTLICKITSPPNHFVNGFQDLTIKIKVWKEIGIKMADIQWQPIDDSNDPYYGYYVLETCEGLTKNGEIITLKSVGGAAWKWKGLTWKPINGSAPTPKTSEYKYLRQFNSTFDNNSLTRGEYRYIVTLSYDGDSISQKVAIIVCTKPEIKSVTATLKANELNPTPKDSGIKYDIKKSGILSTNPMEINGECYINDVIQMQCDLEGGSNYSQGWEYKFNDENPISMQGGIVSHLYDSSGDNKTTDNFQIFYNYKGKYYTNNKEWYKSPDKYRFNFKVYETPTCTPNLTDSADVQWGRDIVDVYAGGIPISVDDFKRERGNPDGWIVNDSVDNSGSTVTFNLHVENKIDNNVGYRKDFKYPIRLWEKVKFSDLKFTDATQGRDMTNQLAIREGNTMSASITPMQCGYYTDAKNTYFYDCNWPDFSNGDLNCPDHTVDIINNDYMEYRPETYKLKMDNMGPYGNIWDSKTIAYEVKVYNKPETPISIIQKGNGASGTMIATANVSDEDLENRKYYLVFGYTDENGKDYDFASQEQKAVGQVRFSSQFKGEQQMAKAYVYALWKYPDGVEITSGKCKRVGNSSIIDENYDSSTYTGATRSVIGGDNPDVIETIKNTSDVRYVYTLDGIRVGTTVSGLKPGLYIVEYADGKTNKISIK